MEAVLFIIFIMMFGAIVDSLPKKNRARDDYYSERMRKSKQSNTVYIKKNDVHVEPDVVIDLTYEQYLKTGKWKALKRERLEIDNYTCQQCGCDVDYYSSNCHHITYKNLYNENVNTQLTTVCKECHDSIHNWHGKGAKYYPLINADFAYKRPL